MRNLSLSILTIGLLSAPLMADDTVTLDQVPAPVKAAITTTIANGTLVKIEKDDEDGAVTYEIKYTVGSHRCEATFSADGKLVPEKEENDKQGEHEDGDKDGEHEGDTVTIDQVPAPVKVAITNAIGSGILAKIEKEHEHGVTSYEIKYTVDGHRHETKFAADGKILPDDEENDGVKAKN